MTKGKGKRAATATPSKTAPAKGKARPRVKALPKALPKAKPLPKQKQGDALPEDIPLTASDERFISEYMIDMNGTQAYMRVHPGVKEITARTGGSRMLAKRNVSRKLALLTKEQAERLLIDSDAILLETKLIAFADMRELAEYRYLCCRSCHGKGFKYQRTIGERDRDFEKHEAVQDEREWKAQLRDKPYTRVKFDEKGGTGYNLHKEPHKDCPECSGIGVGRMVIKDTSRLSPGAVALYAGVKEGKDGTEIKPHSKLDALEKLYKHKGLYEADNTQKDEGVKRTPEAMAEMYAGALAAAEAARLVMVERRKQFEADDAKEAGGGGGTQG